MIDIHSHILPFFDDGAQTWDESLVMARQAYEDGIRIIIATPHHYNGRYISNPSSVLESVEVFNAKLNEEELDVTILPGQEIRLNDDLLKLWDEGELMLLNDSRYMLLEFPSSHVPDKAEELVYELSLLGIHAVIAHPERNAEIVRDPQRLRGLVELGALGQLTAQSVTGDRGSKLQKISLDLCKDSLVHFIAADAHDPVRRPFRLAQSYKMIEEKLGTAVANYYQENAVRLTRNEAIPTLDIQTRRLGLSRLSKVFSSMFGLSR
ncbi:tyrosine-protein phosphatase [Paenibacillus sp. JSM ZJ436]|uniref:tyrosine-protein phosphatase n=1 Tax=Paenibacillus sp. JSM ZJ436 TaxID=3376190 RepID=UPI0037A31B5B